MTTPFAPDGVSNNNTALRNASLRYPSHRHPTLFSSVLSRSLCPLLAFLYLLIKPSALKPPAARARVCEEWEHSNESQSLKGENENETKESEGEEIKKTRVWSATTHDAVAAPPLHVAAVERGAASVLPLPSPPLPPPSWSSSAAFS